jgi:hypothetical protein
LKKTFANVFALCCLTQREISHVLFLSPGEYVAINCNSYLRRNIICLTQTKGETFSYFYVSLSCHDK